MINFKKNLSESSAKIILIDKNQIKSKKYNLSDQSITAKISSAIDAKQFTGQSSQLFPLLENKQMYLLVGLGEKASITLTNIRITIRKALLSIYLSEINQVEIIPNEHKENSIKAIIEGCTIGTYVWNKYISKTNQLKNTNEKEISIITKPKKTYHDLLIITQGVNFTRDLVNDNADIITSKYFEKIIIDLTANKKNISLEILNEKELKSKGLNLHLAVNQGSNKEPKLIIVKYTGDSKSKKYTALVGKGITFDSGGLNLKPTSYIEVMKQDMAGSAAILGTLKNIINLKSKKNAIFAFGLAENAIGSNAYKPGDVICGYAKKSVEIANTDAEGRLVLADAISYLVKNYKPFQIIDIATLTGACIVALGHDYTGLMSSDETLANQLLTSAEKTDDRLWRLPSYSELKDSVKSKIADIKNLGFPKGAGGAITAGEFLRQFTEGKKWAHLDIAGTAFVDGNERLYFGCGATGAGVRVLTHFIESN